MFGELRPMVPVEVIAVIDAVCIAEGEARGRKKSRDEKVNEILREWAVRKRREATVIANVTRGNPEFADSELEGG